MRIRPRRAARLLASAIACGGLHVPSVQATERPSEHAGMTPLADDELSEVRGADGINLNLSNFSFTSSTTTPFSLTYTSPNGGTLTMSRIDLSRTDDADPFADPYSLTILSNASLPQYISLAFPANPVGTGNQFWTLTADFANCDQGTVSACTGNSFDVGTIQISNLAFRGGGLTIAPSAIANTQGIAFGLSLGLDIASIGIYSRGRTATDQPDTSDSLIFSGIHLADATTGGPWTVADLNLQPGLFNAQTDSTGSYLHFQIGWPTTSAPAPAATLTINNVTFTTSNNGSNPTQVNLGNSSIASMQINYLDIRLRGGN